MKKAIIIVLGLVMAIFISSHFYIFKIYKNIHKSNFRTYLSTNLSQLEKIEISPSELYTDSKKIKWLDKNKEIIMEGCMYDVISIKNSGKTVSLYVVNDHREKEMAAEYDHLAGSIMNASGTNRTDLIKDFLALKFLQNSSNDLEVLTYEMQSKFNDFNSGRLPSVFLLPESPPPTYYYQTKNS